MAARCDRFTKARPAYHHEVGAAGPTLTRTTTAGVAEQGQFGGVGNYAPASPKVKRKSRRHVHKWSVEGMTQSRQMFDTGDDVDGELYTASGKRGNLIMLCDKDEGGCGTIRYAHPFKVAHLPEREPVVTACDCDDCPTVEGSEPVGVALGLAWAS